MYIQLVSRVFRWSQHSSKTGNTRSAPNSPVITTRDGKIQGKRLIDEPSYKADAFLGIPYAQPPTGDMRFRKPAVPNKWMDTRECSDHQKKCVQTPFELLSELDKDHPMSEDCLYLNVFCPGDYTLKDDKYPVMVWMHGGGFTCGSAKSYGDVNICDGLVRRGVIVVTVQYRLGVLGFFTTGDEVCPGNFGLWDQLEALKWVQDNIESFGGDKDNVTLFGQSAGGASVDLLTLSPKSKGLVHKVIMMAGNAQAQWSHQRANVEYCKEYAETKFGIKGDTSQEVIDQLRRVSADKLNPELEMCGVIGKGTLDFCPVIDGDLLPNSIEELRKSMPALPVLAGVTALESAFFVPADHVSEEMLKKVIDMMLPETAEKESCEALVKMYKEVALRKQPKQEIWRALAEILGDRMFNIPTVEVLKKCNQNGSKTFFYVFDYYNKKCLGKFAETGPALDASHCAELAYLFNGGVAATFQFCDHDKQVADLMMATFVNFAKRGDPNEEGEQSWLPCDVDHLGRHLVIDLKPRMEEEYLSGRCARWIELMKKHA